MANVILDHSVQVQQSLAELTFRAGVLCQHIDELVAEKCRFAAMLQNYESTLHHVMQEVCHD